MIICNGVSYGSLTECLEIQKGITPLWEEEVKAL